MLKRFPTRIYLGKPFRKLAVPVFLAGFGAGARAATFSSTPDCAVTGSGWECYFPGIFHFLLAIAVILGLVLLGVIGVAVRSYFRIKHDKDVDS